MFFGEDGGCKQSVCGGVGGFKGALNLVNGCRGH